MTQRGPARAAVLATALVLVTLLVSVARGAEPGDALGRETPGGTLAGYLEAVRKGDYEKAAGYLDLRRIPAAQREARGPELARELGVVLDQAGAIDLEALSTAPDGATDDGLAAGLERAGTVETRAGPVDVLLQRAREGDALVWRVAPATVARIPALYKEVGYGPLGDLLPRALVDTRVLDIALWQWLGLLLVVVLAWAVSWLATAAALHALRRLVRRSRTTVDDALLDACVGPLRLGLGLAAFWLGVLALALPVHAKTFFGGLEKVGAIVAVGWVALRLIDVLARVASDRLLVRGRTAAVPMVPVGGKAAKAVVLVFVALALLQNVGVNVTGILAGLGIGGLAVALAAQKTVENLFGGITLMLDQPVRVGDFCRFGDRIGTVEEVGLRSTRVRTLDRTVVTIPNGEFATLQLENFARRDRIWLHPTLGLRYETTPDQLRHVLVEIRKMLYAHPKVHPDPARIRFVGFGAYSLDLEIFAYVRVTDYGEFLAVQEDVYLRIMDIVAASGTGFAFPSQTTYFARDTGLDPARQRVAESEVRAWRERRELYLPEFPPEQVAGLQATLDYPPAGAPPPRDRAAPGV
ncbi:MAG: hypothetical protein A2W08_13565 [Candidatus Rokubacteria bacterium RBG_16_73_20]|nr:MAG: hypothetical protein A2X52_20160 [Candidatus Rokubacteria bacterium GWC2_70_16]OGK96957.1 MAG: hypothetical protein A2W08_13565 [Candidatus Rokubacteria bacterium RBG_16_73_20]